MNQFVFDKCVNDSLNLADSFSTLTRSSAQSIATYILTLFLLKLGYHMISERIDFRKFKFIVIAWTNDQYVISFCFQECHKGFGIT